MSRNTISSFGGWVRNQRRAFMLSQKQLGSLINYSAIAIRKLEAGDRNCSEELAGLLAIALQVPVHQYVEFMYSARTGILGPSFQGSEPTTHSDTSADSIPYPIGFKPSLSSRGLTQFADSATQIFGREAEIAEVLALLLQPFIQLITLLGPPGVGKSRLAMAVLQHAETQAWPDGKVFVPLVTINYATLIPEAIAAAMGIQEINGRKWRDTMPSQSVFRFIKDRQALLVLDNFEHLPDGVAFLTELLEAAPSIKVLVTSQVNLQVSHEQVYSVRPLPVPPVSANLSLAEMKQYPAVSLFVARAQSRRPSFRLTEDNANIVAALCEKLGGLPLALELAAARLKVQSPQELLTQFQKLPGPEQTPSTSGSIALQWSSKDAAAMPHRHSTLLAALTWSYDLLDLETQVMFEQLGVCHGSCTREMALTMTQGSLESLEILVGQSLIQVRVTAEDGIHLSLLEIFREFALMKLEARGAVEEASRRHAHYFIDQIKRLDMGLRGPAHLDWLAIMEVDTPNVRAALQWCVDHDLAAGFVLATHLTYYWFITGHQHEGQAWVDQLLKAGENHAAIAPESRARLICNADLLHFRTPIAELEVQLALFEKLGDAAGVALAQTLLGIAHLRTTPAEAERHLVPAIAAFDAQDDAWSAARARTCLAMSKYAQADFEASEALLNEAMQIQIRLQDSRALARTQNHRAWLAFVQGDFARALALQSKVMPLNRLFKDNYGMLQALSNMAHAAIELGELTQADACIEEGLRLVRAVGTDFYRAPLLHAFGALAFGRGNFKGAAQRYLQSLAFAQHHEQTNYVRMNLINMAQLAMGRLPMGDAGTDMHAIVAWLSAVQSECQRSGYHVPHSHKTRLDEILASAHAQLQPAALELARHRGSTMPWDTAIMLACSAAECIAIGTPSKPRSRTVKR